MSKRGELRRAARAQRKLERAKPPPPPDTRAQVTGAPSFPIGGAGGVEMLWQAIAAGMSGGVTSGTWPTTGPPISEDEVLAIPAVAASLQLISSFVVQMPLQALDDSQTPPAPIVPTPQILRAPTGDSRATGLTLADWEDEVIRDLALWGNYVAVLGDPGWDGWPRVMFPIRPGWWSVLVQGGQIVYQIGADQYDPSEIFHVAINRGTGELIGRGLLTGNSDLVNAAVAAERFAAQYFATGTVPSVHVEHPNPDLTQTQADDLKAKFLSAVAGTREPVVTPMGTKITVLPNDAVAAQLVEARKWNNQALALALGVPAAMLGLDAPGMVYRNLTQANQQFIETTVMRYLIPVEQQLSSQCLARGTSARFDPIGLLRPDVNDRATQSIALYSAGVISLDEARAMIDLSEAPDELAAPTGAAADSGATATPPPGVPVGIGGAVNPAAGAVLTAVGGTQ
ncbi:MAG TPA: phage portal protein [Caldimonas sp.]|nr:phage portal protein [Caldimonas sp.]